MNASATYLFEPSGVVKGAYWWWKFRNYYKEFVILKIFIFTYNATPILPTTPTFSAKNAFNRKYITPKFHTSSYLRREIIFQLDWNLEPLWYHWCYAIDYAIRRYVIPNILIFNTWTAEKLRESHVTIERKSLSEATSRR